MLEVIRGMLFTTMFVAAIHLTLESVLSFGNGFIYDHSLLHLSGTEIKSYN